MKKNKKNFWRVSVLLVGGGVGDTPPTYIKFIKIFNNCAVILKNFQNLVNGQK